MESIPSETSRLDSGYDGIGVCSDDSTESDSDSYPEYDEYKEDLEYQADKDPPKSQISPESKKSSNTLFRTRQPRSSRMSDPDNRREWLLQEKFSHQRNSCHPRDRSVPCEMDIAHQRVNPQTSTGSGVHPPEVSSHSRPGCGLYVVCRRQSPHPVPPIPEDEEVHIPEFRSLMLHRQHACIYHCACGRQTSNDCYVCASCPNPKCTTHLKYVQTRQARVATRTVRGETTSISSDRQWTAGTVGLSTESCRERNLGE